MNINKKMKSMMKIKTQMMSKKKKRILKKQVTTTTITIRGVGIRNERHYI